MAENEQKKAVISGKAEVKTKKKTFKDVLFKEDFKSVAKFSLNEILIPSFKKLIHDLVTGGADMLMYGTKGAPTKKSSLASKISYLGYYDDPKPVIEKKEVKQWNEISYDSYGDAELVKNAMLQHLRQYKIITVADMMEFSDLVGSYTDHDYGWTNLEGIEVARRADGRYIIANLPRPLPIAR